MAAKKAKRAKKTVTGITIKGTKPAKGERMTGGSGWRLAATRGKKRIFNATLVDTVNQGSIRLAIFKVPK